MGGRTYDAWLTEEPDDVGPAGISEPRPRRPRQYDGPAEEEPAWLTPGAREGQELA